MGRRCRTGPRRRPKRRPGGGRWTLKRALRRQVIRTTVALAVYVVGLNAVVTAAGDGYPHPLSPRFVPEKTIAVLMLARHALTHVGDAHAAAPQIVVRRAARQAGVAPELLLAIARVESDLRPHRISHAGAMGMMQLMPATATHYGVSDPYNPQLAAEGAARFVASLSRRYRGDARRIAAAYNAGPGRVARRGPLDIPAETRVYVTRVLREAARVRHSLAQRGDTRGDSES